MVPVRAPEGSGLGSDDPFRLLGLSVITKCSCPLVCELWSDVFFRVEIDVLGSQKGKGRGVDFGFL